MTEYDKKEFRGLLRMMLEDEELLSMLIEYKKVSAPHRIRYRRICEG